MIFILAITTTKIRQAWSNILAVSKITQVMSILHIGDDDRPSCFLGDGEFEGHGWSVDSDAGNCQLLLDDALHDFFGGLARDA